MPLHRSGHEPDVFGRLAVNPSRPGATLVTLAADAPRRPVVADEKGDGMSIGDEDITLEPNEGRQDLSEPNPTDRGGEGAGDGGANPHGHDGGADGSA